MLVFQRSFHVRPQEQLIQNNCIPRVLGELSMQFEKDS